MHPTAARLRLAVVTLVFACALALTGVVVQKPQGGLAGAVATGFIQGWPIKYAVPGTGVIVNRTIPR